MNPTVKRAATCAMTVALTLSAGCATILGSPTQLIPIASEPAEATIKITDEKDVEVFRGTTPTNVALKKSNGGYFAKKSYNVTIEKEGFASQTIPVKASANGLYIGGNLIFGGLIGWLIVDPLGGHMYNLSPDKIQAKMAEKTSPADPVAHNNRATDGSIFVVLLEQVPAELRSEMVQLY